MKRKFTALVIALFLTAACPTRVLAAQLLIPGGQLVALELKNDTLTVAAFDECYGENAKNAGLQIGDQLLTIDGQAVTCAGDIRTALEKAGDTVRLTVLRGSRKKSLTMTPCATPDGPRLGLHLRQGIAGVGTVTYYDPENGIFATLGHGVCDAHGTLLHMTQGHAREAVILSIQKGTGGSPGQLRGSAGEGILGQLLKNSPQGVFGKADRPIPGQPLPTAAWDEIQTGPATIRCTLDSSGPREYSVEILKIYPNTPGSTRNLLLHITDPNLLTQTGGIIQGMSGSPILQNGKLVGAVTHVLVNDPTRGYGIFIENMLDAAG